MPHKVFISYSLEDKLVADAACAALEAQRIPCWIAPRDLPTLQESHATISEIMAQCRVVLLVYSATSIHSPDFRRELESAMSLGIVIAPFRAANVPPYNSTQLALMNTHWLDVLTPALESNLAELCGTITHLLAQQYSAEPPQWRPQHQRDELTAISGVAPEPAASEIAAEVLLQESPAITSAQLFTEPAVTGPIVTERVMEPVKQTEVVRAEPLTKPMTSKPTIFTPLPQPVYSWPSPPQSPSIQNWSEIRKKDDETVEQNRFWDPSRITFTLLLCAAFAFMLFLFLRDSRQRSVQANSAPGNSGQAHVVPYITPGQLTPTVVQYNQPIQNNADSITVVPETPEKVPALARAKTEPSMSGQPVHKTADEMAEHPPKTDPAFQGNTADSKVARPDSETGPTWTDAATGLMWTKQDSGESRDLSWNDAIEYCKNLQLDGHSDWRLPALGELEGIFDSKSTVRSHCCGSNAKTWHVKGGLQLSGWEWSSSPGENAQTAVYLSFDNADEYTASTGSSFTLRALCVRKAR